MKEETSVTYIEKNIEEMISKLQKMALSFHTIKSQYYLVVSPILYNDLTQSQYFRSSRGIGKPDEYRGIEVVIFRQWMLSPTMEEQMALVSKEQYHSEVDLDAPYGIPYMPTQTYEYEIEALGKFPKIIQPNYLPMIHIYIDLSAYEKITETKPIEYKDVETEVVELSEKERHIKYRLIDKLGEF